ncbi:NUDIX hydrolase [Paenibacillus gansuensis]|uniref:NUDIX hydrolase n=1 Tax=Paenibacillus gansuensis TaxID=306542 RepID=A0ABW5PI53_9BACL
MNIDETWHRHLGVYGICLDEGKLLVVKKGRGPYIGRYDLPGGSVEVNESLQEALQREFREETGIDVHVAKHLGARDYIIPYELPNRGTSHIHQIALFYAVKSMEGTFLPQSDHFYGQDALGALWLPIQELTTEHSSPLVVQAVEWFETGQIPTGIMRLDDWIMNSNDWESK